MKILQSRQFERNVKKFTKQEKKSLDKQILKIADNPVIGSEKKGDLRGERWSGLFEQQNAFFK
ncbi:type II toxin-antitoxin system RelE/ParE family toxin [Desulfobacterium sp. N47]|uniref:type II toxin-antitoxin system RelE/ParE family toxin n=1 Tax=Desulfobacterium sp. N47 TaxID=3115210 RepID=UPI003CB278A6